MAVVLHTTHGDLPILLHFKECPKAAFNFLALCASNYYDNCAFLRYFSDTLLQTGDPTNTGKGGESIFVKLPSTHTSSSSSSSLKEENSVNDTIVDDANVGSPDNKYHTTFAAIERSCYFDDEGFGVTTHARRGVLSMAHKGSKPNTNASQFLILCSPQPSLDGVYTAFGQVDLAGKYLASSQEVWHDKSNVCVNAANETFAITRGTHLTSSSALESIQSSNIDVNLQEHTNIKTGNEVLQALQNAASLIGTDSKHRIKQKECTLQTNTENDNDNETLATEKAEPKWELAILSTTVLYNPFAEGHIHLEQPT